jgi:hypothetical protein
MTVSSPFCLELPRALLGRSGTGGFVTAFLPLRLVGTGSRIKYLQSAVTLNYIETDRLVGMTLPRTHSERQRQRIYGLCGEA